MQNMACHFNPGFDLKRDNACCMIPAMKVAARTDKTGGTFRFMTDDQYHRMNEYVSKPIPVADMLSRMKRRISICTL